MTREDAIKLLTQYIDYDTETPDYYEMEKACKVALKALEQEPCEDCISRQEAINKMQELEDEDIKAYGCEIPEGFDGKRAIEALKTLQPVKPKSKIGHWEQYGYSWEDKFKCSECGEEQPKILCGERIIGHWSDYCPNCGADMREVSGNEQHT